MIILKVIVSALIVLAIGIPFVTWYHNTGVEMEKEDEETVNK